MTDFVPARVLEGERLAKVALLCRAAITDMYATLPAERAVAIIAKDLTNPDGELGTSLAALSSDGEVTGFYAAYPASELTTRQQSSLYATMSLLSDEEVPGFVVNARALAGALPTLEPSGYYLARIAVDPSAKGTGVAQELLAHLLDSARRRGADKAWLHVRGDNARAIAFYTRAGFATTVRTDQFAVMTLPLTPDARR